MTTITDTHGRSITITPSEDGIMVAYQVTGSGEGWSQDFTATFPATTPQDVAIACIEQTSMPTALAPARLVPVPQTVTRYQAMAMMSLTPSTLHTGSTLLEDVTAVVTAAGGLVLLAWQNASEFDRNGVFISELAGSLSLTSAQLDALFIAAAQITA